MDRSSRRHALVLGSLLVALPARASVPDLMGYGARGMALAGAVCADAQGHEAVYYNPAGLVRDTRRRFTVGYQQLSFALERDGQSVSLGAAPATLLGFEVPLPFGSVLRDRLALGAGFVIPVGSVLLADVPRPDEPSFLLVEDRAQTVSLQVALGARLSPSVALGAGFIALARLGGGIVVAPNETGRIGSTVNDELLADYAPILGLQWQVARHTAVGVALRGESMATFSLPLDADLGDGFPIPVPRLDISGVAQYDPRQVAVEVSGRPIEATPLRLGGGVTLRGWSAYPGAIEFTAVPRDYPAQPAPAFEDTMTWRVGAEWPVEAWVPRLGLAHEGSPVPPQTGLHSAMDSDRTILGAGLGWRPQGLPLTVDVAAQWHKLSGRTDIKDPAALAPFGPPEENPGWPSISHGGSLFAFGVELGVTL